MTDQRKILFLSKTDVWSSKAAEVARLFFGDRLLLAQGKVGEALPAVIGEEPFEAIISFLCPWVLPERLLARSDLAINFHPGSHAYPGSGCYSFALYEEAEDYGAVCHHMEAVVDAGPIIRERLFKVSAQDTVETLKLRTMVTMLAMFQDIAWRVANRHELPRENRTWTRPAFTLKDLDALRRISADMPADEIARRVRALTYPGYPGAQIEVGGVLFSSEVPQRPPLA